jgi:hypothetical protein
VVANEAHLDIRRTSSNQAKIPEITQLRLGS